MMKACGIVGLMVTTLCIAACKESPSGNSPANLADGSHDASPGPLDGPLATEVGGGCPVALDDVEGKVGFVTYLQALPAKVNPVTVWLRAESLPAVPPCPQAASVDGSVDARCADRDAPLVERQRSNARQIDCVLDGVGFRLVPLPVWYERPYHLTSGRPVPVLLAFKVGLDWSQIRRVAMNPFVTRIDPLPGGAVATGFIPPVPPECPSDREGADSKLAGIASIAGMGRQPVVIETADVGVLPSVVHCDAPADCPEATNALWERTILNTREITCLKRRLDQLVSAPSPEVTFATSLGDISAPLLPPLDQSAGTLKAFGFGLTWEEAGRLAKHPYVERLWTDTGIQFAQPKTGCPTDLSTPIPPTICPGSSTTSVSGKISDEDRALFASGGTAAFDVRIGVAGGAHICPLEACSQNPCPARDAVLSRYDAENLESQVCVRALILKLGGTSSPEVLWGNFFSATLTWGQIQVVAAHPHVTIIEAKDAPPAPPP